MHVEFIKLVDGILHGSQVLQLRTKQHDGKLNKPVKFTVTLI